MALSPLGLLRWAWSAVLLPNVILALVNLVLDGVEAWAGIGETLCVMFFFLRGRSHRSFPLPHEQLAARKTRAVSAFKREYSRVSETASSNGAGGHADSARSTPRSSDTDAASAATEGAAATSVRVIGGGAASPVFVQRRILLGKKGERELWLDGVDGRLLVPPSFPLSYSHSLHLLVNSVVGPIQQPTVTTMPARHPAPQWPPHYIRSGTSSVAGSGDSGGGRRAVVGPTDEYSSSSSRARGIAHGSQADSNSSAAEGSAPAARGARAGYRQAASVVYKRVSTRQMDFRPSRKSGAGAHAIASITAHHVLSYQATRQKVLVMDLDETLCHVSTSTANMLGPPTFSEVIPTASGAELFHVWERPHARTFLTTMAKLFNLVLFTSASKPYADTILRRIDPDYLLKERYYRQDCRVVSRGALAKTLRERRVAAVAVNSAFSAPVAGAPFAAGAPPQTTRRRVTSATADEDAPDIAPSGHSGAAAVSSAADAGLASASSTSGQAPVSGPRSLGGDTDKPLLNEGTKILMKDLRTLKVPLELLIMIDNSEECMLLNRENSLIITPYIPSIEMQKKARKVDEEDAMGCSDPEEDELLLALMAFLEPLLVVPDVRSILRHGKIY